MIKQFRVKEVGRDRRLAKLFVIELRFLRRAQGGAARYAPQVRLDKPASPAAQRSAHAR